MKSGERAEKLLMGLLLPSNGRRCANGNVLKPLNLGISYKSLVIIYLYSPQKLTFPCNLDIELINQSFSQFYPYFFLRLSFI